MSCHGKRNNIHFLIILIDINREVTDIHPHLIFPPFSYILCKFESNAMSVPAKKRELTEKQKIFLDNLCINGGDVLNAIEVAGYSSKSRGWLVRSLKNEIIEYSRNHLVSSSVKAVTRITEALDHDGTLPSSQMDTRLKAAGDILDRIGISKKQEIEHTGEIVHGIVFLPAKQPMKEITVEGI